MKWVSRPIKFYHLHKLHTRKRIYKIHKRRIKDRPLKRQRQQNLSKAIIIAWKVAEKKKKYSLDAKIYIYSIADTCPETEKTYIHLDWDKSYGVFMLCKTWTAKIHGKNIKNNNGNNNSHQKKWRRRKKNDGGQFICLLLIESEHNFTSFSLSLFALCVCVCVYCSSLSFCSP